jgi:hypothetical protein
MSAELHLALKLSGTPVLLGTIVATTTKNNHDTATPFNNTNGGLAGKTLCIQADAACYVAFGTTNAVTATSANFALAAGQSIGLYMSALHGYGWIACLSASGTANLKVFELKGEE